MRHLPIFLLAFMVAMSHAQSPEKSGRPHPREVFCEAHLLPSGLQEYSVLVLLRTFPNVLAFTRQNSNGSYKSEFSITIECTDSLGVIRCSVTKPDSVVVSSFAETRSYEPMVVTLSSCRVPADAYKVTVIVEQRGVSIYRWTSQELRLQTSKWRTVFTAPMICNSLTDSSASPLILGAKVGFSDNPVFLVSNVSGIHENESWTWTCARTADPNTFVPSTVQSVSGTCQIRENKTIDLQKWRRTKSGLSFNLAADATQIAIALVSAELPNTFFTPGSYRYILRNEESRDSLVYNFQCLWLGMPQSYRNEALMLSVMRYLTTDAEYDDLSDGSKEEIRKNVYTWWKKHDPLPSTPYNQALQSCFSRADDAVELYRSAIEPNGCQTARGRVYILFGPPDSISSERSSTDTQREIWIYTRYLKKRIFFDIDDRGVYRLTKVEE